MKKFIFSIIFLILFSIPAFSQNIKVTGIASKGGKIVRTSAQIQYILMETYPSCTVTVYQSGTLTLASIFSDEIGTIKSNPFTANSDASWFFYIAQGNYDIKFSGTGILSPFTLSNVRISSATVSSIGLDVPPEFIVSGSPITSTGTLIFDWIPQEPNIFLASPNGTTGQPSFRSLVAADVPPINLSSTINGGIVGTLGISHGGLGITTIPSNGKIPIGNGSVYSLGNIIAGTGINVTNNPGSVTISSTGGTVTSVGITGLTGLATITNSPITSSGNINLSVNTQTVNATTSGATLSQLETEVNSLKEALRVLNLVTYPLNLATLPGPILGWKANTQSYSNNDPVNTITDSSGAGNNGVQATGTNQPVFKTNIQNGLSIIRYDGSNDFTEFTSTITTARTIYIVYKHNSSSQNLVSVLGHATLFPFAGEDNTQLISSASASSAVLSGAAYVNGFSDAVLNVEKNSSEFRVITFVTTSGVTIDSIFNDRRVAGRFLNGDFGELWIYSVAHNAQQISDANNSLKAKWGITNTNPLRKRVVVDGDSISDAAYEVRVKNCLVGNCGAFFNDSTKDWFSSNFAGTGRTLVNMIADAPAGVDVSFSGHRGKEVVIGFGGTNDFYFGDSLANVQANYQNYCAGRRAIGYKVVATTILPRSNSGTPGNFETNRLAFNTWLRANWTNFADKLADYANDPDMGCTGCETNTTYYSDLVHPNDTGKAKLAVIASTQILAIP